MLLQNQTYCQFFMLKMSRLILLLWTELQLSKRKLLLKARKASFSKLKSIGSWISSLIHSVRIILQSEVKSVSDQVGDLM